MALGRGDRLSVLLNLPWEAVEGLARLPGRPQALVSERLFLEDVFLCEAVCGIAGLTGGAGEDAG